MYIVGFVLMSLGAFIGVLNWYWGISRIVKKSGPSAVMLVGIAFMTLGILLMPGKPFLKYLWFVPFIDFTAIPMLVWSVIFKLRS